MPLCPEGAGHGVGVPVPIHPVAEAGHQAGVHLAVQLVHHEGLGHEDGGQVPEPQVANVSPHLNQKFGLVGGVGSCLGPNPLHLAMAASPAIIPECFPLFEGVEVPKPVLGEVLGHRLRVLPDLGVEAERGEGLQEVLLHALHVSKPLPQHL